MKPRRRTLAGAVAAVAALAAAPPGDAAPGSLETTAQRTAGPTAVGPPTRATAWLARLMRPATARTRPAPTAAATARLQTHAPWNGGPVVLLVLNSRTLGATRWLKVQLPQRPNGTTGWVRADRVDLTRTRWRIEVSLQQRTLRLIEAGRTVHRTRIVVGARTTPTPVGLFAVSERVRQPDGAGFIGPWALHLTASSSVLDDYGGGPGRVAIHGRGALSRRSDPLGSARSHGCLRVPNATVRLLARHAREGTPVHISP